MSSYNGDGTFTDYTIASALGQTNILNSAFGARMFDFDNDSWRDLLVANGHILDNIALYHPEVTYEEEKKLYRNMGNGRLHGCDPHTECGISRAAGRKGARGWRLQQ